MLETIHTPAEIQIDPPCSRDMDLKAFKQLRAQEKPYLREHPTESTGLISGREIPERTYLGLQRSQQKLANEHHKRRGCIKQQLKQCHDVHSSRCMRKWIAVHNLGV